MTEGLSRPAWVEVDLEAVRHNVSVMRHVAAPAALCAVVKADAYGHGAAPVARAAIEGGAAGLSVAMVEEGVELREARISAPVLLLSEPPAEAADALVAAGLTPTLYSTEGVEVVADAAKRFGTRLSVHVKVDTGMHRVGANPEAVPTLVELVAGHPALRLEGIWTHLAVAEGTSAEDREFTALQLQRFEAVLDLLRSGRVMPTVLHAANSAGAIAWPEARYDMVRCGITLYGELPSRALAPALADAAAGQGLRPAMSLRARVSAVRELDAGERPSYGRRRPLPQRSVVATVPVGYADGVPRRFFEAGGEVLVGGCRRPLAGAVTMDQIVVDCGPGVPGDGIPSGPVNPGDEVVLIGRQGDEEVTAEEWARLLGTISYEVLTGIGSRVPRMVKKEAKARWKGWLAT